MAINPDRLNSVTDGDFSGTVIPYNYGYCLKFHFAILSFRYFIISPFRVLNTPLQTETSEDF